MTDRSRVLTVLLDDVYREDDLEALMSAIGMLKHVVDVTYEPYTGFEHLAIAAAKLELRKQLLALLIDTKP